MIFQIWENYYTNIALGKGLLAKFITMCDMVVGVSVYVICQYVLHVSVLFEGFWLPSFT